MVLAVSYSNDYWGSISSCHHLGGINETSPTQPVTCNVASSSQIYFTNVGSFVTDPYLATSTNYRIKLSFSGSGLSAASSSAQTFTIGLYANYDAFHNGYQGIFSVTNTLSNSCFYLDPNDCYYGIGSSYGNFVVQKLTDTYIQVMFSPNSNLYFSLGTSYQNYFVLTFNAFTFGPNCAVSNVIGEFTSGTTAGSGTNTTFPADYTACNSNTITFAYMNRWWNAYWGGNGGASNNWFYTSNNIIFYVTISPDPNRDLPTFHH
ncbi:unnamed protein product [Sphagnum balticum]